MVGLRGRLGAGIRVIAAFFGPYAPEALIAHVSVFSHDFKRFKRSLLVDSRVVEFEDVLY
jgi:hypothetical protein